MMNEFVIYYLSLLHNSATNISLFLLTSTIFFEKVYFGGQISLFLYLKRAFIALWGRFGGHFAWLFLPLLALKRHKSPTVVWPPRLRRPIRCVYLGAGRVPDRVNLSL
jgi:hypothetical protein